MTNKNSSPNRRPIVSPLRYPGGKSYLYPRLRSLVRANGLSKGVYVEPYAGGAGAALGLLMTGEVAKIAINDLSPAIYAFWQAVTQHSDDFIDRIKRVALTVDEWERQREIYQTADRSSYFDFGFAVFYLNRTNRSGALNGGPIGGKDQTGRYKIDARFNRGGLSERVRLVGLHRSAIALSNDDGIDTIKRYADDPAALIYADPPYFEKAGSLYMNYFTEGDHAALAECLNSLNKSRWILTYDDVPQVATLYADRRREYVSLNYSAHRVMKAQEIMIFADSIIDELALMQSPRLVAG